MAGPRTVKEEWVDNIIVFPFVVLACFVLPCMWVIVWLYRKIEADRGGKSAEI